MYSKRTNTPKDRCLYSGFRMLCFCGRKYATETEMMMNWQFGYRPAPSPPEVLHPGLYVYLIHFDPFNNHGNIRVVNQTNNRWLPLPTTHGSGEVCPCRGKMVCSCILPKIQLHVRQELSVDSWWLAFLSQASALTSCTQMNDSFCFVQFLVKSLIHL